MTTFLVIIFMLLALVVAWFYGSKRVEYEDSNSEDKFKDRIYILNEDDAEKMNIILSKLKTLLDKGYSITDIVDYLGKIDKNK